jgi:hypothetical protein
VAKRCFGWRAYGIDAERARDAARVAERNQPAPF